MSKVAVLKTTPTTVLSDYGWLMRGVGHTGILSKDFKTVLKLNLSWILLGQHAPACRLRGHLIPCALHKMKGCAADR